MLTMGSVRMGDSSDAGRRPEQLTIDARDADALHAAAHSDSLPWSHVRRAKIVMAIAAGEHLSSVAARLECDEATVWMSICFNAHDECFENETGYPPVKLYGLRNRDELTEYCKVTAEHGVKPEVEAFHYGGI